MRWRVLRAGGVIAALLLFMGPFGACAGLVLALAYEVVGVPLGGLWGAAVAALAAAPIAMVTQTAVLRIRIGAGFATANVLARGLVGLALACALYAAIAELTGGRRAAISLALTPWERLTLALRRRRGRATPVPRSDQEAPQPPAG